MAKSTYKRRKYAYTQKRNFIFTKELIKNATRQELIFKKYLEDKILNSDIGNGNYIYIFENFIK